MPEIEYRHDLPRRVRQVDLLAQVVPLVWQAHGSGSDEYRAATNDLNRAWPKVYRGGRYLTWLRCEACDRPTEDYTMTVEDCRLCPRCAAGAEREHRSITITGALPCDDPRVPNDRYVSVSGDLPADTPEFLANARYAGRCCDVHTEQFIMGWTGQWSVVRYPPTEAIPPLAKTRPLAIRNAIAALRSFALGVMDRADELEQAALAELDAAATAAGKEQDSQPCNAKPSAVISAIALSTDASWGMARLTLTNESWNLKIGHMVSGDPSARSHSVGGSCVDLSAAIHAAYMAIVDRIDFDIVSDSAAAERCCHAMINSAMALVAPAETEEQP